MTAQEASKIANQYNNQKESREYTSIKEGIKKEASKGYFEYWFDGKLNPLTEKILESEGYLLAKLVDRDETTTRITW